MGSKTRDKITRRRFLRAAAGGVAWVASGVALGCESYVRTRATASPAPREQAWAFRTRPDLNPPASR